MLIVVERDGVELELELEVERPEACVADLTAALGSADGSAGDLGVVVDGRLYPPDRGLDELPLRDGVTLHVTSRPPPPAPLGDAARELAIVAGPDAGGCFPLEADQHVIGRGARCDVTVDDPTLSIEHALLEVDETGTWFVRDLGSSNGTWVDGRPVTEGDRAPADGLLRFGAVHARIRPRAHGDELRVGALDGATTPFNRPPRPGIPQPPPDLEQPEPPKEATANRAFSAIALVGPLLMGGVLIAVTGNVRFALFMLMSPVMLIGNHFATKRRSKKEAASSDREFRAAMERLREDVLARAHQEIARREQLTPDLAEVRRRAEAPAVQLWQARPHHDDYLRVRVGSGAAPWDVPIDTGRGAPVPGVEELMESRSRLPQAPVMVDLVGGSVVGIVGDRTAALALARGLLSQLVVHQGPADLQLLVASAEDHATAWDWVKWLPHTRDATGAARMLTHDTERSAAMLQALVSAAEAEKDSGPRFHREDDARGPVRCLVVDDTRLLVGRRAPARLLLGGTAGPVTGIVIAEREDQLPAVCDTVVDCRSPLGDAVLRRPQERLEVDDLTIAGASDATARAIARALARFEDPELANVGAGLPGLVRLLPLLDLDEVDASALQARWTRSLPDPPLRTPIGRGEDGVIQLDLVSDGPHGLIGGTTGSGKSELLRSLVAGLAAQAGPDHLVFVLVDYKGGSAFAECAKLPHTVGMVTDLDEHLGERALRSLEAELHHRERVLRDADAQDLPEYRRLGTPLGPMPRLVVVIDEFATLASELPDFLGALVGIAQRGRSLGVHLLLATQRPRGAVDANMKANTNLRIALRVQDATDSTDIIDTDAAAKLSRATPGRAYVRRGPDDVELVQTPLSTIGARSARTSAVQVRPFTAEPTASRSDGGDDGPSDLARLVTAANDAFRRSGSAAPREPWLEMLSEDLALADLLGAADPDPDEAADAGVPVPFALADEPDQQRQTVVGWDPGDGHLALYGTVGSGTTTALMSVAASLSHAYSPQACHLYVLDFGAGELAPLAQLPAVGSVIGATDREGQFRLIRTLRRELDRRRDLPAAERVRQPAQVVLIDGVAGFLGEHEGMEGAELVDAFTRLFTEGPSVGLTFVVTGVRPGALPMRMASLISQRMLFRLADRNDYSSIGLRSKEIPSFVPGRAVRAEDHRVVQVGHPGDLAEVAARVRQRWDVSDDAEAGTPVQIASLPGEISLAEVPGAAEIGRPLRIPVGLTDEDLGPAVLELHAGEHAMITGPPRSGKSSLLRAIAQQLRAADPELVLVGVCSERSPLFGEAALDAFGTPDRLSGVIAAASGDDRPWVVLVDDAGSIADEDKAFDAMVKSGRPDLHVIVAGRTDELSGDYGRWTRTVRQSRNGVLLQPNLTADGGMLGAQLPRRLHVRMPVGRGFVVASGLATLAQLAMPVEPADGATTEDASGGTSAHA